MCQQKRTQELRKQHRRTTAFPPELAWVTDQDRKNFALGLEVDSNRKSKNYGQENLVAQTVTVNLNFKEIVVNLTTLTVSHLRQLCKNLGIMNCGSLSKYEIRRAIATYFSYQERLEKNGMLPSSAASRMTSTVCRAVNVIFSKHFIEDFKHLNDRKTRRDHETSNSNQDFWIRASIAHNSCIDGRNEVTSSPISRTSVGVSNNAVLAASHQNKDNDASATFEYANVTGMIRTAASLDNISFSAANSDNEREDQDDVDEYSGLIFPHGDCHLHDLANDVLINLLDVSHLDTQAFKNKITGLYKMRNTIQNNMTVSGTHDNTVWNFLESAMSGRGGSGVTKIYEDESRSTSTVSYTTTTDELSARKKSRSNAGKSEVVLMEIKQQGEEMLKHLSEASQDRKLTLQATQRNRSFRARLEVAKALGDTEELRKLMAEAKRYYQGEL
ncbi:hypothetical protein MHU86_21825 [Fragilaria crotonensis]|nr:hypothetical protein MHU86_21825 [Fragilaria crotonensis]